MVRGYEDLFGANGVEKRDTGDIEGSEVKALFFGGPFRRSR